MEIRKKVDMPFFQRILDGKKKFEIRLADFECNKGDILILEEWDPETKQLTGRSIRKEAAYVLKTNDLKFWKRENIEKYGFQVIQLE